MEEKKRIKIALGEFGTGSGGQELFEKLSDKMAREAAWAGAKILCLPELSACGYFIRREELLAAALTAGEQEKKMAATAKKYGISLIFGYPERDGEAIYNSCLAVGEDGSCIQNIRKVNLWKSEKKRFSEGWDFPVFETCAGRTAAVLCYDLEFPEPARIVSMNGARLIFCPAAWSFADGRSIWLQPLSAIWPLWREPITGMKTAAEVPACTARMEDREARRKKFPLSFPAREKAAC